MFHWYALTRKVPPWISEVREGKNVVALGNREYPVDISKPPAFFFPTYLEARLPKGWLDAQNRLAKSDQHPLALWAESLSDFLVAYEERGPAAGYRDILTPKARSMFVLAYDMYSLDGNARLQESVLSRLLQKASFQGAKHELGVAATMMRAGFEIDFEDETDSSRKHPEFLATHRVSKMVIGVEAKSIHRTGVLGFDSGRPPPTIETGTAHKIAAQVCGQVQAAVKKTGMFPLYVFVDLNLPMKVAEHFASALIPELQTILPQIDSGFDTNGIFVGKKMNLLTVTNWPMHLDEELAPGRDTLSLFISPTQSDCAYQQGSDYVDDVKAAVKAYGTVADTNG